MGYSAWWTALRPAAARSTRETSGLDPRKTDREPAPGRRRAACIVVHNYFPWDPRVRREAEALLSDGWSVDIICLREPGQSPTEDWHGAMVHRLPVQRHRGGAIPVYLLEYAGFFLLSALHLARLNMRRRFDLVQAHNVPDFLVFTAVPVRPLGTRVLLDIRDPLPDLYASKFGGNLGHPVMRLIRLVEACSIAYADHVLTPGEPSRRRLIGRNVPPDKVTNVLNSADPSLFFPVERRRATPAAGDRFTLAYHGGLFERYGLDIAVRAVARLRDSIPGLRLRIAGYGEEEENLRRLVADLGLNDSVSLEGWIEPAAIPQFVAGADLGIVPYRQDTFTDLIYPTKAFEYIAMGLPVIMSGLAGVRGLFPDVPDAFFPPGDVEGLAQHIRLLHQEPKRLDRLIAAEQCAYVPYSWEGQRQRYLALVRQLVSADRRIGAIKVGLL